MAKKLLKPKHLECYLQQLDTLVSRGVSPNAWDLEQYATPPHIASNMLLSIENEYGDIRGKNIADLGCGCGVLSIGCALLGANKVLAVDIDRISLEILSDNIKEHNLGQVISFKEADVVELNESMLTDVKFDVVIMNPPFGTKKKVGIDRQFVEVALRLAPVVYSLHKSSTRDYWTRSAATELSCKVEPQITIRYNLDKQFKYHLKNSVDIDVDLLKFMKH